MTDTIRPLYGAHGFIGNNHADRRKVYVPLPLTIPPQRPSLSERAHTVWRVTVGAYRFVAGQLSPQGWRVLGKGIAVAFLIGGAFAGGIVFAQTDMAVARSYAEAGR